MSVLTPADLKADFRGLIQRSLFPRGDTQREFGEVLPYGRPLWMMYDLRECAYCDPVGDIATPRLIKVPIGGAARWRKARFCCVGLAAEQKRRDCGQ